MGWEIIVSAQLIWSKSNFILHLCRLWSQFQAENHFLFKSKIGLFYKSIDLKREGK